MPNVYKLAGIALALGSVMLASCKTTVQNPSLPSGAAAYEVISAEPIAAPTSYTIMPGDTLGVTVFGEPDLSAEKLRVDDAGLLQLPLVGELKAGGKTPQEFRSEITGLLAAKYIRNPQVAISVVETALRHVTVEGEVKMPGIYEIDRNFTLLSAVARAQSPTETAKLDEVIIFRTIAGRAMAARFDLRRVRTGIDPDPQIYDGDVVMVPRSGSKSFWQDVLKAAPIFSSFVYVLAQ